MDGSQWRQWSQCMAPCDTSFKARHIEISLLTYLLRPQHKSLFSPRVLPDMAVGPFSITQPNPTQPMTLQTQPNLTHDLCSHALVTQPNPTQHRTATNM